MRKYKIESSVVYHIYNRGVSKRSIFLSDSDYRFFIYKFFNFKKQYFINCINYCLMPNHYHFLIYTKKEPKNISNFIKSLQVSYSRHFNNRYKHSGHVFQGAYNAKPILDPVSMEKIIKYIKNNPVKNGLVKFQSEWKYSG